MPTNSLWTTLSRLSVLVPLLVAVVWAAWSCRSLRRWSRSGLPWRGVSRWWRLYLPLGVELASVWAIWILVPARVQTTMDTIALFAPDVFAIGVAITVLAVGCAIARIWTLRSQQGVRRR